MINKKILILINIVKLFNNYWILIILIILKYILKIILK